MPILKSEKIQRGEVIAVNIKKLGGTASAKAGDPRPGQKELVEESPEILLAQAKAQAEAILRQAQNAAAQLIDEARKQGREAGYIEGVQAAEQEFSNLVMAVKQVSNAAVEAHDKFLRHSQNQIGLLAIAIAEKIVGKELTINPTAVTEIVAQAIKEANITGSCYIRVNPHDYELLSPAWESIPSLQPSDRKWNLVADKNVSRGGCLIEADGGILDAQIESQLSQVGQALQKLNS